MFVVLEGPNGVGKSTIAEAVAEALRARGDHEIVVTREPSDSPLGHLIRNMEHELAGEALCHACVADRLHHYAVGIAPVRAGGGWIICDRYVPSSLVLQRLDGLELERIWTLNEAAAPPDLTIYLADDPATLQARLATREQLSRLEKTGGPARELELYRAARRYLDTKGWRSVEVDCRGGARNRSRTRSSGSSRGDRRLAVTTLNVGAAAAPRAREILRWLRRRTSDVLVLSETSAGPGTDLLADGLRTSGYLVLGACEPQDRGVLIAVRGPATEEAIVKSAVTLPSRAVCARLGGSTPVNILGVYVPSRDRSPAKIERKRDFIGSCSPFFASWSRTRGIR